MKYTGFIFLAILFFLCSLGINLYFYYVELLEKSTENSKEGFTISQNGIIKDNIGNIKTCNTVGDKITYTRVSGDGALTPAIGKCMDISYVDQNGMLQTNTRAYIYSNYYIDHTTGILQPVPYGYAANADQSGYYAISNSALIETSNNTIQSPLMGQNGNRNIDYNPNASVTYNSGYTSATDSPSDLPPGKMFFPNGDGTRSIVDINAYDQARQYHETATYDAGPRNFMPNYEPSIYISKLSGQNIQDNSNKDPIYLAGAPIVNTDATYIDIGKLYANDSARLEAACNKMDPLFCASSNSCVLLGGQKCVSGDKNGPKMKSNYSDYLIMNRDYYYFQGKCYGMCPPIPTTAAPTTAAPTTSAPTTAAPMTTFPMTTNPMTTFPMTTFPMTTFPMTTNPMTTNPMISTP